MSTKALAGKVALVAGATRGAGRGIAVELGNAGAIVYCTGRTTRASRSEMDRPETIEETAEMVTRAGGRGMAVQVDHLVPGKVKALVERIGKEQGALHILVNDIFGATRIEWGKTAWESDLEFGLRSLRLAIDTHAITSHFAIPLLLKTPGGLIVEVNDGTEEYNQANYRNSFFYDLAKAAVGRMGFSLGHEVKDRGARAVVALAADKDVHRWNGRSLSAGQLARVYGFADVDGSRPDAWRHMLDSVGKVVPPDIADYR